MKFEGKVALVTGASGGIGMATARRFADLGARVAATGRNGQKLSGLTGSKLATYAADLTNPSETENLIKTVLKEFGGIDILVNAAGIIASGTIENTTLADYDI